MLLPRFTIRTILAITTGSALVCVVFALAARGHQWALACSLGILSVGVTALVHAALFGLLQLFARLLGDPESHGSGTSSPSPAPGTLPEGANG